MPIDALLDHFDRVVPLNEDEKSIITPYVVVRSYKRNEFVLREGDVANKNIFVLKGALRTYYRDQNGNEHIIHFSIEDWWAGDLRSYNEGLPSQFHIQCIENTQVALIQQSDLEIIYDKVPKIERYFRILTQRGFASLQYRIVENLSLSAEERYLEFKSKYAAIESRVPQYMIASYLGFTPEFLSKLRRKASKS